MKLRHTSALVGIVLLSLLANVTEGLSGAQEESETCPAGEFPDYVFEEVQQLGPPTLGVRMYLE